MCTFFNFKLHVNNNSNAYSKTTLKKTRNTLAPRDILEIVFCVERCTNRRTLPCYSVGKHAAYRDNICYWLSEGQLIIDNMFYSFLLYTK